VTTAADRADAVEAMLEHVFPALHAARSGESVGPADRRRWRETRRVALPANLRIYLEKALPGNVLPTAEVAQLAELLAAPEDFAAKLSGLSDPQLGSLLSRMSHHIDRSLSAQQLGASLAAIGARAARAHSPLVAPHATAARSMLAAFSDRTTRDEAVRAAFDATSDVDVQYWLVRVFAPRVVRAAAGKLDPIVAASLQADLKSTVLRLGPDEIRALHQPGELLRWLYSLDHSTLGFVTQMLADDELWIEVVAGGRPTYNGIPAYLGSKSQVEERHRRLASRLEQNDLVTRRASRNLIRILEPQPE
jgi:hypothetical protein